jgi:N-acetylglutamate synthase-like GNAT family acetyltransferase
MGSDEHAPATRIRPARIGDASDVARLLDQLGYPCTRDEAAERIVTVLGDPRQQLLIAERDGHACGLISLNMVYSVAHGADLARITSLVVADDCLREGIGRRLLREVEVRARQAGISRIEVTSGPQRETAHAFYRGCGYSEGSLRFVKLLGD